MEVLNKKIQRQNFEDKETKSRDRGVVYLSYNGKSRFSNGKENDEHD